VSTVAQLAGIVIFLIGLAVVFSAGSRRRRDWTDEDLSSALRKIEHCEPGGWVELTDAEVRAHIAFTRMK